MPLVAGVDSSTQATKVVVVDADDGTLVARGRAPHDVSGSDGARESDPEQWWQALATAMAATGRAGEVAAIAVAAQQHGLVVLDDHGRPLRDAKLWNDTQSAPQADALTTALGGPRWWANEVGVVPVASFTATKWAWLREHEPAVADRAATVCLPHDFLNLRLTGAPGTDRGDASGTGWYSTHHDDHVAAVLDHIELDRACLGVVHRDGRAGEVTPGAADALGLPVGTPVGAGTGDNAGAALGLGVAPGEPVVSLGTSGTAYCVLDTPVADPSGMVAGFADATTRFLPLAATLNCTLAVDRMADLLGLDREDVAASTDAVVLPYLDGERTPNLPDARASILGVTHDTSARELLWATYLGAAASLVRALDRIGDLAGGLDEDAPLTLVGGGALGQAWRRALQTLTGRALRLPAASEVVALGGAAQAAALLSGDSPYTIASNWQADARVVEPARDVDVATLERMATAARALADLNETAWR